ncbi:MAG: pyrroloquinoline quinone-dependent dehydrogenase [Gammaproteobacteria bacterium]|nr:pyrroloquinoline quinone-dependent dehydrogenase [Gammaproteobacteria bacterium]
MSGPCPEKPQLQQRVSDPFLDVGGAMGGFLCLNSRIALPKAGSSRSSRLVTLIATALAFSAPIGLQGESDDGWPHYGGSLSGDRYASPSKITAETADRLVPVWTYRTGDAASGEDFDGEPSRFRATPILFEGKLIASTGFNRVFALNPGTGEEIWAFDPKVDFSKKYSEMFTSRGVAAWKEDSDKQGPCRARVFLGTLDARLLAIDVDTGELCSDFGRRGEVDLSAGIRRYRKRDYSVTSPPTVVGNLVIVGSAIGDNGAAHLESGVVRAYDARDGSLVWAWDPIPRAIDHPGAKSWTKPKGNRTGGANVWSVMSADPERDLVFLPTTSPSPDFYGGERLGDNALANSVVSLKASTGEFVWGYQTVRHDLWDYDLASQPLLFEHLSLDGTTRPAIAQATKTGFVFVLDRTTGEPLHPIEDRRVPQSSVPGEVAAKKQPFPKLRLHDTDARPLQFWNFSEEHLAACKRLMAGVRYEGMFTPPSLEGTLLYPGNPGGTNWGSMAYDRSSRVGYLVVSRWPTIVKLIPRNKFRAAEREGTLNGVEAQHTEQNGTPYGMARTDLVHNYLPCLEGPWSTLVAVDLDRGEVLWERAVGTTPWVDVGEKASKWGYINSGGPIVTEGGVVFLATTYDNMLRAYDGGQGNEIWNWQLPAGVHATPMAYQLDGMDYVVITAGGDLTNGTGRGDHVVAFRLEGKSPSSMDK